MSAQCGRVFLLYNNESPDTLIGKCRSLSISFGADQVDITNKDSTNGWREILANCGVKTAEISVSGVFDGDDSGQDLMYTLFINQTVNNWRVEGTDGYFSGDFLISAMDRGGEYAGEQTFSATLTSAGAVTYTAV